MLEKYNRMSERRIETGKFKSHLVRLTSYLLRFPRVARLSQRVVRLSGKSGKRSTSQEDDKSGESTKTDRSSKSNWSGKSG